MDWGIHFPSHIQSYRWVSHAEDKGFSHYMPYDSIGSDVYETLALCAVNTKKIKIGPGVTSPRSRIAPVTARAMVTLNELAPGRCVLGFGTGNTARRAWGMPIAKLQEVKEEIEIFRRMFRGEEALYSEGPNKYMSSDRSRYVKFLSPDWGFINTKDEIPIYLAGSGPRTLELAGEIADGIILLGAIGESFVDYCMKHIAIGAERAGRDPDKLYKIVLTAYHILEEGEALESESVRKSVGPVVAVCLNIAALSLVNHHKNEGNTLGEPLPGDIKNDVIEFKDAYPKGENGIERSHFNTYGNYFVWNDDYKDLITPEAIKTSTLVGKPEEILDTVRRLESQGINQVMIAPLPEPIDSINQFHDIVMSNY